MFGDEIFVGVECGGPIRGRKGDAFGGGEDGLDEVVGVVDVEAGAGRVDDEPVVARVGDVDGRDDPALLGDGAWDALAWLGLGLPAVIGTWPLLRR